MIKRLEARIFGRVQMVMFRDFVKRGARRLQLSGWVKNNPDGTVSVVAEGGEVSLRKLLLRIQEGSMLSRVDRVEEGWKKAEDLKGEFYIHY